MRRLYPEPAEDAPVPDIYTGLDWAPRGDRPFMALNMVSSVDGRATWNGKATGIGSRVDHALMMALRSNPDALLHGAGTVRVDRIGKGARDEWVPHRVARGLAPQPLLVLLTASGDVQLDRSYAAEPERIIVFVAARTPREAVARLQEGATVRVAGEERPDPARAVRILGDEFGVRSILCEGGPVLNHSLITANVLDELFLTVAPKFLAGDGLPPVIGPLLTPPVPLSLLSLYEHEGELFLRYGVGASEQESQAPHAARTRSTSS